MPGTFGTYVVIDPTKLAEVLRGPNGPVARRLIEDAELVKIEAKRLVGVSKPDPVPRRNPRRPGTLRDSIVKRLTSGTGGELAVLVGTDSPIGLFHHEGTVPHSIDAKPDKHLVFYWPKTQRVMVVRHVQHPGTKPNRFLVNALRVLAGRA